MVKLDTRPERKQKEGFDKRVNTDMGNGCERREKTGEGCDMTVHPCGDING
jgi:hypothetical protein